LPITAFTFNKLKEYASPQKLTVLLAISNPNQIYKKIIIWTKFNQKKTTMKMPKFPIKI
jgi:hypothetical protein